MRLLWGKSTDLLGWTLFWRSEPLFPDLLAVQQLVSLFAKLEEFLKLLSFEDIIYLSGYIFDTSINLDTYLIEV